MSISILAAGPKDWAAVRALRLRALQEVPAAYGSTYAAELRLSEADWQERLATAQTYLALDANLVVGMVTAIWARNADMHLDGMYVAPPARGSGGAQALIEAVVELTQWRGGDRVVLQVTEGNAPALRCYEQFGFVSTGRRWPRERDPDLVEIEYAYPVANLNGAVLPRG